MLILKQILEIETLRHVTSSMKFILRSHFTSDLMLPLWNILKLYESHCIKIYLVVLNIMTRSKDSFGLITQAGFLPVKLSLVWFNSKTSL